MDKTLTTVKTSDEIDSEENAIVLIAEVEDKGMRIDAFIAGHSDSSISRTAAQKLIADSEVMCNGKAVVKNYKMNQGDVVSITFPSPVPDEAAAENIPLDIVYEDDDIIVVNKKSGMVVHPAPGHYSGTLVNALLYHCMNADGENGVAGNVSSSLSGIGGVVRPGIVHRIDRDTSGLLVVAKNDAAHGFLSDEIKNHDVKRVYFAVVTGNIRDDSGIVDAPIGRHPVNRKKMAVIKNSDMTSREAVTRYEVIERYTGYTFLRLELETGRTHQIRVHMNYIGHPVLGDEVYGGAESQFVKKHPSLFDGQCLHAGELHLIHPVTKEMMHFFAPMPENMIKLIEILKNL